MGHIPHSLTTCARPPHSFPPSLLRWLKSDDGGCYVISRAAFDHPYPPPYSGRAANVEDMISGYVVR